MPKVNKKSTKNKNGRFSIRVGRGNPKPKPPKRAGPGRPPGMQNRLTRDIKEAIVEAATIVGEDGKGKNELVGYMIMLARKERKIFGALLGRALPAQVNVRHAVPEKFETVEQLRTVVQEQGLSLEPLKLEYHDENTPLEGEILPPVRHEHS